MVQLNFIHNIIGMLKLYTWSDPDFDPATNGANVHEYKTVVGAGSKPALYKDII